MSPAARLSLVDRADPAFSIVAQCQLLKVARSTLYYRPAPVSDEDLAVMRRIDSTTWRRRSTDRGAWWRCCAGRAGR